LVPAQSLEHVERRQYGLRKESLRTIAPCGRGSFKRLISRNADSEPRPQEAISTGFSAPLQ
jgi:hypothetical protein